MSYNNISLQPSRPAPAPPGASRPSPPHQSSSYRSASASSSRTAASAFPNGYSNGNGHGLAGQASGNSSFSSTTYSSAFPVIKHNSALSASTSRSRNTVVRTGPASVKEEGLRSFLWSKRWLVLGGQELQIFKNEVRLI